MNTNFIFVVILVPMKLIKFYISYIPFNCVCNIFKSWMIDDTLIDNIYFNQIPSTCGSNNCNSNKMFIKWQSISKSWNN